MRNLTTATRVLPATIYSLECSLYTAQIILQATKTGVIDGTIDPISWSICNCVNRLARLEAAILMLTTVRYAELPQVDLSRIISGKTLSIREPKTHNTRSIFPLPCVRSGNLAGIDPGVRVRYLSYDAMNRAIQSVTPRHISSHLKHNCRGTHIFRHLRATWMHLHGADISEIQKFFGHKFASATQVYVHDNISVADFYII